MSANPTNTPSDKDSKPKRVKVAVSCPHAKNIADCEPCYKDFTKPYPTPSNNELEDLIEKLADIEHQRWSDWQKWCHQVLRENLNIGETWEHELNLVLERWDKQIATPYSELSEAEKQSDRDQVARYLPLLNNWANKKVIEALENVKGNVGQLKHSDVLDEVDNTIDSELEALRKKG